MAESNSIEALRTFLYNLPSDQKTVSDENCNTIWSLLGNCWTALEGSDAENTKWNKLYRSESIQWNPPILSFILERHGGLVLGSTRADVHYWNVDVEMGTASIERKGYRQKERTSPRMNTKPIAQEIAKLILNGALDSRLNWDADKEYVILTISKIIPEACYQRTTQGRRDKFKAYLEEILIEHGWIRHDKVNKTGFLRKVKSET